MIVRPVTKNSEEIEAFWSLARSEATKKRGGEALLSTIEGNVPATELLAHLIEARCLWSAINDETLVGFVLYRNHVVEALYVDRHCRRQGIARSLLGALRELETPPLDAYALPGDRAMKSLYESIGWKARLLTMRGG